MPPRSRVAVWPALLAYACAFLLLIAADSMLLFGVGSLRSAGGRGLAVQEAHRFAASPAGVMTVATANAAVLLLVALLAARLQGHTLARLRIGASQTRTAGLLAAVLGTIGLSVAGGAASGMLGVAHRGVTEMIETALTGAEPATLAAALATIALAPGIAEETFFRGLMQTRLVAALGRWPGIAISSLAFGVLHMDLVQGSLAFVIGLFLGWCAERLGGIRPTIAAHAVNNAVFIVSAAAGSGDDARRSSQVAALVGGCLVCAASTAVLRARIASAPAASAAAQW